MLLANRESMVESLKHAYASLCSFKHGYLSLPKYSLCKNTPLRTISKIVESILNRQADCISSSIHLATNAPRRRKAPLGTVAGQPGLRPARMHNYTDRKKEPYLLVWFFFSNRQLSILPGRFQPSTFDV